MPATVGHAQVKIDPELNNSALKKAEAKLRAEAKRWEKTIRPEIRAHLKLIENRMDMMRRSKAMEEKAFRDSVNRMHQMMRLRERAAREEQQNQQKLNRDRDQAFRQSVNNVHRIMRLRERSAKAEQAAIRQRQSLERNAYRARLRALEVERKRALLVQQARSVGRRGRLQPGELERIRGLSAQDVELELKGVAVYKARLAAVTRPVDQEINIQHNRTAFDRFRTALEKIRHRVKLLSRAFSGFRPITLAAASAIIFLGQSLFHIIGSLGQASAAAIALPVAFAAIAQGALGVTFALNGIAEAMSAFERAEDLQAFKDAGGDVPDTMLRRAWAEAGASLQDLGKAGAKFVMFIREDWLPAMREVQLQVREAFWPHALKALKMVRKHADGFADIMAKSADKVGRVGVALAKWATSARSLRDFGMIGRANIGIMGRLGTATINLLDVIRNLWAAAIPLTQRFTRWLVRATEALRQITEKARDNGSLERFFKRAGDAAAQWGRILANVAVALFNTFKAAQGESGHFVDDLEQITEKWRNWTASFEGQEAIRNFFKTLREVDWAGIAKTFLVMAGAMAVLKGAHATILVLTSLLSITGIAALGIVALAGAFAAVFIVSEPLRKSVLGLFGVLKDKLGPIIKEIFQFWRDELLPIGAKVANEVLPHLERAIRIVTDAWKRNKDEIFQLWKIVASVFIPFMGGLFVVVMYAVAGVLVAVIEAVGFLVRAFKFFFGVGQTVGRWLIDKLVPVFRAVGAVAKWLWQNAIGPAFRGIAKAAIWLWEHAIRPAFRGIAAVAQWLWRNVIRPVFNGIAAVIRWAWQHVIRPVIAAFSAFMRNVLVPVLRLLFNVAKTVWKGVWTVIKVAWGVIKFVFQAFHAFLRFGLMVVFKAFWELIKIGWRNIRAITSAAWNFLLRNVFKPLARHIVALGRFFRDLWKKHVKPVWDGIRNIIKHAWNFIWHNALKPLIKAISNTVVNAFRTAKDAIAKIWDGIKNAVRKPILFVVESVYQNGIRAIWQKIVDKVPGLPDLPNAAGAISKLRGAGSGPKRSDANSGPGSRTGRAFARGGFVNGPGTETSDSIPARLSRGEYVLNAKAVRKLGPHVLDAINDGARVGFAYGGSIDEIIRYANESGAGARVTSAYRPGDPLWHGKKRAVDFGGYNQDRLATHFARIGSNLLELIHRSSKADYGISNGRPYAPGSNNDLLNQHRDHVHVAAHPGFSSKKGSGGILGIIGGFFTGALKKAFKAIYNPMADRVRGLPGFGNPLTKPFGNLILDSVKQFVLNKIDAFGAAGGLVGADGSVMQQALKQAQAMSASNKVLLALFEAGFVESGFRNGPSVRFKDHDSAGFLQQRPSQGWGTLAQVENVPYATRSFVSRAIPIQGRYGSAGQLAQAVQRSAFPDRYDQMEGRARAALRSLGAKGFDSGGLLTPGLTPAVNATGEPEAVLTRRQWAALISLAARKQTPVEVTVITKDEALADFIDVRVDNGLGEYTDNLVKVSTAKRRRRR